MLLNIGGSGFGFTLKASGSYNEATDKQEEAAVRSLAKGDAEVIMATAQCLTHSISLSDYVRPLFTANFIQALESLDSASRSNNSDLMDGAFVRFTLEFGTHFIKRTEMGAELLYERRYNNQEEEIGIRTSRKECVKKGAKASLGGGGYGFYAKVQAETQAENCRTEGSDVNKQQSQSEENERTITRGSRPVSLEQWVTSDFTPVPINRKLNPISQLFRNEWLTKDKFYEISRSLDGTGIRKLYNERIGRYCELILSPMKILDKNCKKLEQYKLPDSGTGCLDI